jgi:hypothetical protein
MTFRYLVGPESDDVFFSQQRCGTNGDISWDINEIIMEKLIKHGWEIPEVQPWRLNGIPGITVLNYPLVNKHSY